MNFLKINHANKPVKKNKQIPRDFLYFQFETKTKSPTNELIGTKKKNREKFTKHD